MKHQDLRKLIHNAKEIARTDGYCDRLFDALLKIRTGYVTVPIHLSLKAAYRARLLKPGVMPSNLSELWHPLPGQVLKFGRVNLPHSPVLYCSDRELVAINEVGGKVGDHVAILEVGLAAERPFVFSIGEVLHRYRTKRSMIGNSPDESIEQIKRLGANLERILMIERFFSGAFSSNDERAYLLSAAISQSFLISERIDGLAYPTAARSEGFNLALKPDSALRLLAPRSVKVIRLESMIRDSFKARYENLSERILPDGTILWRHAAAA
ncbi:MAG: RES domain-containing protein [Pseudorhodoplanes sp.]|jgi:hypothetical protein|nr:RES domain-containing protein [Pseudorhodoplanes sp.]